MKNPDERGDKDWTSMLNRLAGDLKTAKEKPVRIKKKPKENHVQPQDPIVYTRQISLEDFEKDGGWDVELKKLIAEVEKEEELAKSGNLNYIGLA